RSAAGPRPPPTWPATPGRRAHRADVPAARRPGRSGSRPARDQAPRHGGPGGGRRERSRRLDWSHANTEVAPSGPGGMAGVHRCPLPGGRGGPIVSKELRWRILSLQIVLVLVLGFCAGFLFWSNSFVTGMVHDELVAQRISFPAASEIRAGGALDPAVFPAEIRNYAGQPVDN